MPNLLARGALAYGFSTDLWTIPRILQVTEAEWGVRNTDSAIWRRLQRHELLWQRPRRQAREKDLRPVRSGRHRSLSPRDKRTPPRRAVVVLVDESGFSLLPYVAETWVRVGQTPVLIHQGRWPKFSAISSMTSVGHLHFCVHEDSIRSPQVVEFLRHLLRQIRRRPITVFWDSGPHHRSELVRGFLATQLRLEVHRFPGYSPELNPDEWVWRHPKNHQLASYAPYDVRELSRGVRLSVMRIRVRPRLIRSFVPASHLFD